MIYKKQIYTVRPIYNLMQLPLFLGGGDTAAIYTATVPSSNDLRIRHEYY